MTAKQNTILYEPRGAILVRTPLLPIESYQCETIAMPRSDWIEPAIMAGSLSLAHALRDEKSASPRLRYHIRMTTRPTPYGLFSGVGLAEWSEHTDLALADSPPMTRSRPDMGWLLRLVMDLESRRDIRNGLIVRANNAALVRGGRVMLAERLTHAGDGTAPPPVSVRATPATLLVLRLARAPIPLPDLISAVAAAAPAVAAERVEGLVHELIDETLLVTDLRPPLTCDSPVQWVLECIAKIPAAADTSRKLQDFVGAARAWDGLAACERNAAYERLALSAAQLGAKSDEPPLQVDTIFALSGNAIAREVGEEVARAASLMLRLTPYPRGFSYLRHYHQAFVARYGEHREVPLLEMLDPHWGLGPPDLNANAGWTQFPERDEALLELACRALRERSLAVELDEAMLSRLETLSREPGLLPESLDVCAFVCASPGGVARGEFKIVVGPNVGSIHAGRNVGRFADALGYRAAQHGAKNGDAPMVAEIVYLPHKFRFANVAIRPVTSDHEITLGVSPGVESTNEIPLDALMVGVEEGRFYLRWPGHAQRLVVTSSHMLNFNEAHPICRFLAHVDCDEKAQLHIFDWGPASAFSFLPRVQAGRIVLRPAQWQMACPEAAARTPQAFGEFLDQQRREALLPRHVYLSNGDVRLLLDLDDGEHTEQLRRAAKRGKKLFLQEPLPGLDDAWVPGPGGHYTVELVVSLARITTGDVVVPPRARSPQPDVPRMIPPGGAWLFLKLYGSADAEDDLLAGPLVAFVAEAVAGGLFEDWFFMRYADPQDHLRIRFRTPAPDDAELLLAELCVLGSSLMDHDLCSRFGFDTYEREIERYGGAGAIETAEALFVADSALVLEMLRLLKAANFDRKVLCAFTALDLLDGVSLGAPQIGDLTKRLRPLWLEAGALYRTAKASLLPLVENSALLLQDVGGAPFADALERRRIAAEAMGRALNALDEKGALTSPLPDIWHSLLHMHCNRFTGRDRAEERLVLGLMLRARDARNARKAARKD